MKTKIYKKKGIIHINREYLSASTAATISDRDVPIIGSVITNVIGSVADMSSISVVSTNALWLIRQLSL